MPDAAAANLDPGSLERLHDIVVPPPSPWWPPAPGWYVVGATVVVVAAFGLWNGIQYHRRNRYRREALRELAALAAGTTSNSLTPLAELLKRTALAAFPRERVASLSGDAWLRFLDDTDRPAAFTVGAGRLLGEAVYRPTSNIESATYAELVARVHRWIGHHRC